MASSVNQRISNEGLFTQVRGTGILGNSRSLGPMLMSTILMYKTGSSSSYIKTNNTFR